MDKLGYITGDLVMTNGIPIGTKKGIVYKVTESNADKYAKVKDGNAFTELKGSVTLSNLKGKTIKDDGFLFCDSGAWVKDIVPIPLAPEILEKNGWKRNGGQYSFTYKPYAGGKVELICFFIEIFKDVDDMLKHRYFQITHKNKVICGCFYVHEIQHLLFGLGLNSEMEV